MKISLARSLVSDLTGTGSTLLTLTLLLQMCQLTVLHEGRTDSLHVGPNRVCSQK